MSLQAMPIIKKNFFFKSHWLTSVEKQVKYIYRKNLSSGVREFWPCNLKINQKMSVRQRVGEENIRDEGNQTRNIPFYSSCNFTRCIQNHRLYTAQAIEIFQISN